MSKYRTHSEIIDAIRLKCARAYWSEDSLHPNGDIPEIKCLEPHKLATQLEATHKREVDALKQRLAELDAEIAAKDEVIKRLNDALAEEQKHSGLHGNMAKLRAVVEDLLYMAKRYAAKTPAAETVIFDSKTHETLKTINYYKTIKKAEAALAAPARECDVGTPAEQTARFAEFCKSHRHSDMPKCAGCPLEDIPDGTGCSQAWGQMPCNESEAAKKALAATEGGAK